MFKKVNSRQNLPEMEKEIVNYWKENKIFEKSVENRDEEKTYSFFDGPPFATGLPHYGHVVASLIKDVVPRFWTMKGRKVERKWGWDCHGLPIENLIEKENKFKNKQDIEKWGVDNFNNACHSSVLRYADDWKKFIPRIGRWVDMENDYKTMDWQYSESIWWVFSELYKKGLIYEGHKAMHICPRCETTLSNFEVTQGYKDITDLSAIVKFRLKSGQKIGDFEAGENTFVLAWTTTPWTLPGNVALAVNGVEEYVKFTVHKSKDPRFIKGESYIIMGGDVKRRLFGVLAWHEGQDIDGYADLSASDVNDVTVCKVEEFKGKDLLGLEYEPLFDYYSKKEDLENKENGWKIYAGDFVSTEEGTGIVHIAPAFGDDDMKLGKKHCLPFVQHVKMSGRFADEVVDFKDKEGNNSEVKPKRNPRETDEKVVKWLEENNKLFVQENYKHSYPHCWRCDTPLLNYATSSWFVEVTKIKERMVENNKQINWTPEYIKEGRFGKWLEDARDWAISRSRYWGAPLPVWKCEKCGKIEVIQSIDELREKGNQKITKFILLRHGESESNVKEIKAGQLEGYPLTEKGIEQVKKITEVLKEEKIDLIISSPILRAKQTADIVNDILGIERKEDERIKEYDFGSWNGRNSNDLFCSKDKKYQEYKKLDFDEKRYNFKFGGDGESRSDVEKRVEDFIKNIGEKYQGKNILVVTHGGVNAMFSKYFGKLSFKETFRNEYTLGNAEKNIFYLDENKKQFSLHKPGIDEIKINCSKCGQEIRIVGDVFDCWFESGSMPYAQWHYPFENQAEFQKSFPAEFIAEGLDQTRGWFYTLMVLSTALFDKIPFKNVIVNGMVLAENGQKMSKRLQNYPEPNLVIEKYGADSLRYYLLSSPIMKGESLRFSEKGVEEVLKKFVLTLWNTYSFFMMNLELNEEMKKIFQQKIVDKKASDNLLDKWIISEFNILIEEVNNQMENYDLVRASRPLREFVDKLSNWYIRRSRKRFVSDNIDDKIFAYQTLHYILVEYAKLLAPFMPFLAEEIYLNLTEKKSVHLQDYPVVNKKLINQKVSDEMNFVRQIITLGLSIRAKNRMKVRQPLSELQIINSELQITEELLGLIKDELNVKEIKFVEKIQEENGLISEEDGNLKIALNLQITIDLKIEGLARELVRHIQVMRKEMKYNRDDTIQLKYFLQNNLEEGENVFQKWNAYFEKDCLVKELEFCDVLKSEEFDLTKELKLGEFIVEIGIKKL